MGPGSESSLPEKRPVKSLFLQQHLSLECLTIWIIVREVNLGYYINKYIFKIINQFMFGFGSDTGRNTIFYIQPVFCLTKRIRIRVWVTELYSYPYSELFDGSGPGPGLDLDC